MVSYGNIPYPSSWQNALSLGYTLLYTCRLGDVLGSGQFGTVYKGVWQSSTRGAVEVAVKTLKKGSKVKDRIKFLREAAIMGQFKDPNVIEMYGFIMEPELVSWCEM